MQIYLYFHFTQVQLDLQGFWDTQMVKWQKHHKTYYLAAYFMTRTFLSGDINKLFDYYIVCRFPCSGQTIQDFF